MADRAHDCVFPEVLVEDDSDGPLKAGMKVLAPCSCGETPMDHVEWLDAHVAEMQAALLERKDTMPLFHWAPSARRKQILRYGLRPGMRPTTSSVPTVSYGAPCVCLADSASWAWALSGEMDYTPSGEWDLWQTQLDRLVDPIVLPSPHRMTGIYEVRTEHRVYKRDLWWVGSRVKS